jgi:hypothetical protein
MVLYRPVWHDTHSSSRPPRYRPGTHTGVGAAVGNGVGTTVGVEVGLAVGAAVGAGVGDDVGASVGIAAHSVWADRPPVHVLPAQSWHSQYETLSWYLPDGQ